LKQAKLVNNSGLISRDELGSWLWGAADILRGAVSAEDYGDFILPLLFYKRLSDVYVHEYNEKLREYGDEQVAKSSMFFRAVIPEGCLWEDVRKTAVNVGAKLNETLGQIAKATPRLDRVINRTDFNNPNAIPEERLVRLIEHFSQKSLSNGNVTPDILGDGYEYLLKKFNEVAPKRAGEFYTPREVVKVLVGCLKPEEGMEVYDPCCGTGGMLIESYYYLKRHDKDPKKLFLYGQELNDDTWAIAKMNEWLHDMEAEIFQGDTFVNPRFLDFGSLRTFDVVVANPMWNQKGFKKYQEDDRFGRFNYGVTTNSSADWGWIQHMLSSLKPEGRMGIVLDQGALFRGGAEGKIRKGVIKDDLVECVVALPEKLFYNTGAPGCLIFLNRDKASGRRKKVLFVYAAEGYEKLSNMNQLRDEDISRIVETFDSFAELEKYSQVVDLDEVKENDYNLSVTRYVDIFDPPEPIDIQQVWNQLKELEAQRNQTEDKLESYMKELGIE
jgi:type I restriction enzyme M protein